MTPFAIRALRQSLGLTQAQLAAWLGMDRSRVSEFERGKINPSPTTVRLLTAFKEGYRPRDDPS